MMDNWSEWRKFPDPRKRELLVAPFGPGCYELRCGDRKVLFGQSKNVAQRMTSLLPEPWGDGTRKNEKKQCYVLEHIDSIEYRTIACDTHDEAKDFENQLKKNGTQYEFMT